MIDGLFTSATEVLGQMRWADALDILVVSALVYASISWLGRAQSRFVVRGLAGTVALYFVARLLDMHLTLFIFQALLTVAVVALVVIFQEDIRRAFERIAMRARLGFGGSAAPHPQTVKTITRAVDRLAAERTGALIVLKGREPLDRHLSGGVVLQGRLSEPLLYSIFDTSSPGHDGGLVLDRGTVDRFGVHLPLTTQETSAEHGTRHAAALGLAERSDALVVVVSEERGTISVARSGKLEQVTVAELRERLTAFCQEHASGRQSRPHSWVRGTSVKLLSVGLAAIAWAIVARSQTQIVERTFTVPVVYRNVPEHWLLEEPDPSEVRVTLHGQAVEFRGVDPARLVVPLDVSQLQEGTQRLPIDQAALGLPAELTLERMHPTSIEVVARQLVETRLRVKADTTGRLHQGLVLRTVKVQPTEVSVLVPAMDRARYRVLDTAPLDLSTLDETTTVERQVLLPEDLQSPDGAPLTVRVTAVLRGPSPAPAPAIGSASSGP